MNAAWARWKSSSVAGESEPAGELLAMVADRSVTKVGTAMIYLPVIEKDARSAYDVEMTWLLAVILRPVAALIMLGLICLPVRLAVQHWMPAGRLKSLLLKPVGPKQPARHSKARR